MVPLEEKPPKSLGFVLWGPQKLMAVHLIVVKIFQCELKHWNNQQVDQPKDRQTVPSTHQTFADSSFTSVRKYVNFAFTESVICKEKNPSPVTNLITA